jgi:ABC-type lipoprotein release transport system permease subunit
MTTWRIAWRSLWRNRRRTFLAVGAIALSVTLVLAYNGLLRGYGDWMLQTITGPLVGHAQVHAPEWRQTRAMDRTLSGVSGMLAEIRRHPNVTGATPRVYAPALAALGQEGFTVFVLGVDAEEYRPNRLLAAAPVPPAAREVLIGHQLAAEMRVAAGAVIALVGQGADGSLANDLYTVAGTVKTPVDLVNRQGIVMSLASARDLFVMPDEAHEIVVFARDPDAAAALAADVAAMPALGAAEVLPWQALAPAMVDLVRLVEAAWMWVLALVFVAAAAGVANTMLMATFERTHEFGMLLALGTAPARLVRLIALEALALGFIGAAAGAALGVALVAWGHQVGVDYAALTGGGPSELSFAGLNWSLTFYPSLGVVDVARVFAAVVLTSLVASAWPALRVARLQPARALRE